MLASHTVGPDPAVARIASADRVLRAGKRLFVSRMRTGCEASGAEAGVGLVGGVLDDAA